MRSVLSTVLDSPDKHRSEKEDCHGYKTVYLVQRFYKTNFFFALFFIPEVTHIHWGKCTWSKIGEVEE